MSISQNKKSITQKLATELIGQEIPSIFVFEDKKINKYQARIQSQKIINVEFVNHECNILYSDGSKFKSGICEIPYIETDILEVQKEVDHYNSQNYYINKI